MRAFSSFSASASAFTISKGFSGSSSSPRARSASCSASACLRCAAAVYGLGQLDGWHKPSKRFIPTAFLPMIDL
jgi:hypothetical protein